MTVVVFGREESDYLMHCYNFLDIFLIKIMVHISLECFMSLYYSMFFFSTLSFSYQIVYKICFLHFIHPINVTLDLLSLVMQICYLFFSFVCKWVSFIHSHAKKSSNYINPGLSYTCILLAFKIKMCALFEKLL